VGTQVPAKYLGKNKDVRHFGKQKSPNSRKILGSFYAIWKIYVVFSFTI
jgi:hypothetical protein